MNLGVCVQGVPDTVPAVRLQPSVAAALDQREEHRREEHTVFVPAVPPGPLHHVQAGALHLRYGAAAADALHRRFNPSSTGEGSRVCPGMLALCNRGR